MQKGHVDQLAEEVVALIEKEDWHGAHIARTALVDWITNVIGICFILSSLTAAHHLCGMIAKSY